MEAIFRDGGRQYKVKEGARVEVDYRELEPGASLEFPEVLYVGQEGAAPRFGTPLVDGARVVARVLGKVKGKKLVVMSFRRRKNSRRRVGHRQVFTAVEIQKIEV
jgi:large subunit ribosomal protein L21